MALAALAKCSDSKHGEIYTPVNLLDKSVTYHFLQLSDSRLYFLDVSGFFFK